MQELLNSEWVPSYTQFSFIHIYNNASSFACWYIPYKIHTKITYQKKKKNDTHKNCSFCIFEQQEAYM